MAVVNKAVGSGIGSSSATALMAAAAAAAAAGVSVPCSDLLAQLLSFLARRKDLLVADGLTLELRERHLGHWSAVYPAPYTR